MVITTFNILPQQEIDRRVALLKDYEHCPLCDSKMLFQHNHSEDKTTTIQVVEKSFCPSCSVTIHEESYTLQ